VGEHLQCQDGVQRFKRRIVSMGIPYYRTVSAPGPPAKAFHTWSARVTMLQSPYPIEIILFLSSFLRVSSFFIGSPRRGASWLKLIRDKYSNIPDHNLILRRLRIKTDEQD
jgi:hypothetical protein